MKPMSDIWVLVADSGHARLFVNHGPKDTVHEEMHKDHEVPEHTAEIMTDQMGRYHNPVSGANGSPGKQNMAGFRTGQSFEPDSDPKELEKQDFLKRLASEINAHTDIERLIVAAPPKALGTLRQYFSKQTRDKVIAEIGKDLTKIGERDLPHHLKDVMAIRDAGAEFNYEQARHFSATNSH